jgi:hypothetical protein
VIKLGLFFEKNEFKNNIIKIFNNITSKLNSHNNIVMEVELKPTIFEFLREQLNLVPASSNKKGSILSYKDTCSLFNGEYFKQLIQKAFLFRKEQAQYNRLYSVSINPQLNPKSIKSNFEKLKPFFKVIGMNVSPEVVNNIASIGFFFIYAFYVLFYNT